MIKLLRSYSRFFFCSTEVIQTEKQRISKFQIKNFADSVKLNVKAGNGGHGSIGYYTDKRVRKGAPDGGCGGHGGDIVLQTHKALHDLSHLRLKKMDGIDGLNGGKTGMDGKNGGKNLINVPVGTAVYEIKIDEEKQTKVFLTDMRDDKLKFIVAKGGRAGKGNKKNPHMYEDDRMGQPGEEKIIYLELKLLADIGLVGFPNIGKSTFLAASTRALPKIANYEFTTLKPSIGLVKFVDGYTMSVADIPGIVEDAHLNKGLGLQFLRHIERTKILVFMLDITHNDPFEEYRIIEKELQQYKNGILNQKKRIVVFNKKDCLPQAQRKYNIFKNNINSNTFLISSKEGQGVGDVVVELRKIKTEIEQREKEQEQKMRGNNFENIL